MEKVVDLHLEAAGFTRNLLLRKYLLRSRCIMLALVFIFVCQELCGIIIPVMNGNFTTAKICLTLIYIMLIGSSPVETYIFFQKGAVARMCLKNSEEKLHCLSCVDTAMIQQKHMPLYKFFLLVYIGGMYTATFFVAIISPLIRFGFKIGVSSYILYPVWYPVDVFSHGGLFWAAFFYETVLYLFAVHAFCNINVVLLHVFTTARIRLEVLNKFLAEMSFDDEHQVSVASPGVKEHKSHTLRKAGNPTRCGLISKNTATSDTNGTNANHPHWERLKQGVEDLYKLRRQAQLINNIFKVYLTVVHTVAFTTISVMPLAGINGLRNSDKPLMEEIPESFFFFFITFTAVGQIFTVCYNTTTLQDTYDDLRFSLWKCDWYAEKAEFKKLFMLAKSVLNQPLTMKAYTFYPINLRTFNHSLKQSWGFFLFLYQLTAPK